MSRKNEMKKVLWGVVTEFLEIPYATAKKVAAAFRNTQYPGMWILSMIVGSVILMYLHFLFNMTLLEHAYYHVIVALVVIYGFSILVYHEYKELEPPTKE